MHFSGCGRIGDMETKRLYRSETNRIFAGILGGFGEFFNIDPVLLRVFWILVVIFTGFVPGVLAYLLAIFIIPPHKPKIHEHQSHQPHHANSQV
jgi:phage shock protein C